MTKGKNQLHGQYNSGCDVTILVGGTYSNNKKWLLQSTRFFCKQRFFFDSASVLLDSLIESQMLLKCIIAI